MSGARAVREAPAVEAAPTVVGLDRCVPAFLAVVSDAEPETLIGPLQRLHENLPAVERATDADVAATFPATKRRARAREENEDE